MLTNNTQLRKLTQDCKATTYFSQNLVTARWSVAAAEGVKGVAGSGPQLWPLLPAVGLRRVTHPLP